jgi:hypothetical protein
MARKQKRRTTKAGKQRFVVARLDKNTVLAGWCVAIDDAKLAAKVGAFVPTRGVTALATTFVAAGETAFVQMMGGNLFGTLGPPRPPR